MYEQKQLMKKCYPCEGRRMPADDVESEGIRTFATLCFVGSFVALCSVRPERHSARGVMKARGVSIVVLAGSVTDNKNEESENATQRRKKLNLSKC